MRPRPGRIGTLSEGFDLGGYRIAEQVGAGAVATVWRGKHVRSDVEVAVKVLSESALHRPHVRSAFRNEVRACASVDHPAIARVYDLGEVDAQAAYDSGAKIPEGSPYLVMPYLAGGSVKDICGKLSWWEIRNVLLMLLDALAHAHARGLVHRDIKPANVLLNADRSRIRLTDFGLAHAVDSNVSGEREGFLCGTPLYMAPEQCTRDIRDYGPWTDFYALGCLAYALAQGSPAFIDRRTHRGVLEAQIGVRHPRLQSRCAVPARFQDWLWRMVAKDPAERPQRASVAAAALAALPTAWDGRESEWIRPADEDEIETDPTLQGVARATLSMDRRDIPLSTIRAELGELDFASGDLASESGEHDTLDDRQTMESEAIPRTWRSPADREDTVPAALHGVGLELYWLRRIPVAARRAERDRLWDGLRAIRRFGQPVGMVVRGPAGMGKSRLAQWLCERGHEIGGADWLHVAHDRSGLDPFAEAFNHHFRLGGLEHDTLLVRADKVLHRLGIVAMEQATGLVRLVRPGSGMPLDQAERHALVVLLIERLARSRPLVLWLDDVHWSADTLAIVRRLLDPPARSAAPLLVVMTAQNEALAERGAEATALAELVKRQQVEQIELAPLQGADLSLMVRTLLPLEPALASDVEARCGGNPQLAVQLIGHLVDHDSLRPGPSGFRPRGGVTLAIPDTVQQAWTERVRGFLGDLPDGDVVALELAAMLGRDVDADDWADVCRFAKLDPSEGLADRLLDASLATCGPGGPAEGWSFVHQLARETLLEHAADAGRGPELHEQCARWLRGRRGFREAEQMALHLEEAGRPEEAIAPLQEAIARRLEAGELRQAEALLKRHERVLNASGASGLDRRRGRALLLGVKLASLRGDDKAFDAGIEELQTLLATVKIEEVRSELDLEIARREVRRGNLEAAKERLDAVREDAEIVHDERVLAPCLFERAALAAGQGERAVAQRLYQEALLLFEKLGDVASTGRTLLALAELAARGQRTGTAQELIRMAEGVFQRSGSSLGGGAVAAVRAVLARTGGDLRAAEDHLRVAVERYNGLDAPQARTAEVHLAQVLSEAGAYDEAETLLLRCLSWFEDREDPAGLAATHLSLLPTLAHRARWAAFDDHLQKGRDLLEASGLVDEDLGRTARVAGDLAAAAGVPARAWAAFQIAKAQLSAAGEEAGS